MTKIVFIPIGRGHPHVLYRSQLVQEVTGYSPLGCFPAFKATQRDLTRLDLLSFPPYRTRVVQGMKMSNQEET